MNVTLVLNNAKVFRSGVFSRSSVSISLGNGVSRGGTISTMDASSFVILPGFVDVHVHLREPGFFYKETIATGTAIYGLTGGAIPLRPTCVVIRRPSVPAL